MSYTDAARAATRLGHIEKLLRAFTENLRRGDCEYGAWGQDDKRPFGNSDVAHDIAEIIGLDVDESVGLTDEQADYCNGLYDELPKFLRFKLYGEEQP